MVPEDVLGRVCTALEVLIEAGSGFGGLFPSLLDRRTHRMLTDLPEPIHGQRQGDRSHLGSNLMHDEVALKTLYGLSAALDRPKYAAAADQYLQSFVERCTHTATGLFPWGEHAFWHLLEERVGSGGELSKPEARGHAIHDHLRQAPVWLWEKLQERDPGCVQAFADGLDYHWTEGDGMEYIRHAHIEKSRRHDRGARSCDFPRHGGFYILDWAFAYQKSGRPGLVGQIRNMLDNWWPRRDERGLLQIESRSPETDGRFHDTNAPGQTLSLGASLLESVPLLGDAQPELQTGMRERALAYIDGFLAAPHDLARGVFVSLSRRSTNEATEVMPIWGSVYGVWPASYVALTALCAHRLTGDERLLDWAAAVAGGYAREKMPDDLATPAMDAGLGLGLLVDLYAITGDQTWLDHGMVLAEKLLEVYLDADLPRGAAGIDWYESQMGPGFLLHGLARVALLAADSTQCFLEADYTAR